MKSAERYELIQKGLSEGKTKSQIAREQGVTPALISQTMKKHAPPIQPIDVAPVQEVAAETAEA